MNSCGYLVNTLISCAVIYKPIHSAWFIDWCAALDYMNYRRDLTGTDCHIEVLELRTNKVVLEFKHGNSNRV
jgi:hypothetical protein